jgi:hypothetical protein
MPACSFGLPARYVATSCGGFHESPIADRTGWPGGKDPPPDDPSMADPCQLPINAWLTVDFLRGSDQVRRVT